MMRDRVLPSYVNKEEKDIVLSPIPTGEGSIAKFINLWIHTKEVVATSTPLPHEVFEWITLVEYAASPADITNEIVNMFPTVDARLSTAITKIATGQFEQMLKQEQPLVTLILAD